MKTHHAHGCRHCRVRYEDSCDQPKEDALCVGCRGGLVWAALIASRAALDCCRATARMVTKYERDSYGLAGRSNWHICGVCHRTHPTNPRAQAPNT